MPSPSGGSKTQWFNPDAWTVNGHAIGTNGDSGRHVCDGPGFFRVDAALYKNISSASGCGCSSAPRCSTSSTG